MSRKRSLKSKTNTNSSEEIFPYIYRQNLTPIVSESPSWLFCSRIFWLFPVSSDLENISIWAYRNRPDNTGNSVPAYIDSGVKQITVVQNKSKTIKILTFSLYFTGYKLNLFLLIVSIRDCAFFSTPKFSGFSQRKLSDLF